jgi:hypothetical protein
VSEIVIDANVFAHALNTDNDFFESAVSLVVGLLDSESILALDDTGKASPDEWTSNLYREYTECISPISVSYEVIHAMIAFGRVIFHLRPKREVWAKCQGLAPANNHDAIVLGIGVQTDQKLIISNDYKDFHRRMRRAAVKEIGVTLLDSDEYSE